MYEIWRNQCSKAWIRRSHIIEGKAKLHRLYIQSKKPIRERKCIYRNLKRMFYNTKMSCKMAVDKTSNGILKQKEIISRKTLIYRKLAPRRSFRNQLNLIQSFKPQLLEQGQTEECTCSTLAPKWTSNSEHTNNMHTIGHLILKLDD